MHERDPVASGAGPGYFVDQPVAGGTARGERRVEVRDAIADVVDPWSAPLQEFRDGPVVRSRFQQLDLGCAEQSCFRR